MGKGNLKFKVQIQNKIEEIRFHFFLERKLDYELAWFSKGIFKFSYVYVYRFLKYIVEVE